MFPKIEMVRRAIESLYDHVIVSGYAYTQEEDEITGITETKKSPLAVDETPCRLDVSSNDRPPADFSGAQPGEIAQEITLILNPDVTVPVGSTLTIRSLDGAERLYEAASIPTVYPHHQEISLKLKEKRP